MNDCLSTNIDNENEEDEKFKSGYDDNSFQIHDKKEEPASTPAIIKVNRVWHNLLKRG